MRTHHLNCISTCPLGGSLMDAGHDEMHPTRPCCTRGLRFYQWMMDKDRELRRRNQQRLRELVVPASDRIELFCSHDTREFERVAGRRMSEPLQTNISMGS